MKQSSVFSCEKCGKPFGEKGEAQKHEEKCLPLQVGQSIQFLYGLLSFEGLITGLKLVNSVPIVELETEEVVDEGVVDYLHDGKHVWVTRDCVLSIV